MKLTSSKHTAWYQKLRDTLIPWNKRQQGKDKKFNTNAYAEKATKETVHKRLWQRKKEQTTNAYGKERKTKPQMLVSNQKWLP